MNKSTMVRSLALAAAALSVGAVQEFNAREPLVVPQRGRRVPGAERREVVEALKATMRSGTDPLDSLPPNRQRRAHRHRRTR